MERDQQRWDDRYRNQELASPVPPEALVGDDDLVALLPTSGRALDIACGPGAQALWLAKRGLDVIAIDVSPVAVDLTRAAAQEHNVGDLVEARQQDLDDGLLLDPQAADVSLDGGFDVVLCQRFRDPRIYRRIVEILRPGGTGIVTVLSAVGLDGEAGDFHAPPGDLVAAFDSDDTEVIAQQEGNGLASIVFRRR